MASKGRRKRSRRDRTRNYRGRRSDRQDALPSFLIVCEGKKTEPHYFNGFRVPLSLAIVHVEGFGITPPQLVEKALSLRNEGLDQRNPEKYDQVWCVFDKDDWRDDEFNEVIEQAQSKGLRVAYSNQAFELWFLLHFQYYDNPMHRNQYEAELSSLLGRPYRKNAADMYIRLHAKQETAINNAQQLLDLYIPRNPATDNPSTTVHWLVQELNRFLPENRKNA